LTGLLNRRGFYQRFHQELAAARRSGQSLSLVMIDLDGLKAINDRDGHEVGDRALRALAESMRDVLRVTDVGARLGGDEFALLAPHTGEPAVITLAERIRARVGDRQAQCDLPPASVSLGVVTFDPHRDVGIDATVLMKTADEALYVAKRDGGDRVRTGSVSRVS
jgi:diguanylate cyclase (GGDEF)-like protein